MRARRRGPGRDRGSAQQGERDAGGQQRAGLARQARWGEHRRGPGMAGDVAVPLRRMVGIDGDDGPPRRHGAEETGNQLRVERSQQGDRSGAGVQGRDGASSRLHLSRQAGVGQLAFKVVDGDVLREAAGDPVEPVRDRSGPAVGRCVWGGGVN